MDSWSSPRRNHGFWPRRAGSLSPLSAAVVLALSAHLWAEDIVYPAVLPKEAVEKLRQHGGDSLLGAMKVEEDLELPIADERVLLHLPKRGFPNLAFLMSYPRVADYAMWPAVARDGDFESDTVEERIVDELLRQAMFCRVKASRLATFRLLKELAPTPEALKVEAQAHEMWNELMEGPQTAYGLLRRFKKLQKFFVQLKGLPKLTPAQWAEERAQTAVLTFAEYPGAGQANRPVWPDTFLDWHRKWNHEGYVLAFSGAEGPQNFVVRERGAVFAWNQAPRVRTGTGLDAVESRLPENEWRALQEILPKLPPSDPDAKDARYIVSFLQDGQWITRTYRDLPAGTPFPEILRQMEKECAGFVAFPGEGFQKPSP